MSQEGLTKLIKRINSDASFKKQLLENPVEALKNNADVSAAERVALLTNDADALRRLSGGGDTSGYALVWATEKSTVPVMPLSRAVLVRKHPRHVHRALLAVLGPRNRG